jgi:hypothetical protein
MPTPDAFVSRLWFGGDYLLWWTKSNHVPPLLTTGSLADSVPGALGQPGTQVLFGNSIDSGDHSGGRFFAGYWFGNDRILGVDGGFFFLSQKTVGLSDLSGGDPVLARPFFNVLTNSESAFPLAGVGGRTASFDSALTSRFWGAEANLRAAVWRTSCVQVSVLGGFRYLELNEMLQTDAFVDTPLASVPGAFGQRLSTDSFGTRNFFYGGQLGAQASVVWGRFSADLTGKVALGSTHEVATINGITDVAPASGGEFLRPFGQLALPSNIGRWSRDVFTVVPEGGVNFGYQLTCHVRLTVGYTFLYTSRAERPGNLIDLAVNPTQVRAALGQGVEIGADRPVFPGRDTDFWAQGINFGLEFLY